MKTLLAFTGVCIVIGAIIITLWQFVPSFKKQFEPAKIIQVKAFLDNRCSIGDEIFVAFAPEQNRTARFYDGIAIMRLPENAKIQLAISPAYPDFKYDDVPQDVAKEIVLIADCSVSPRLKSL